MGRVWIYPGPQDPSRVTLDDRGCKGFVGALSGKMAVEMKCRRKPLPAVSTECGGLEPGKVDELVWAPGGKRMRRE